MSLDRRQGGFAGALAALLVLVLLLAGCGGGDDGSGSGGSTAGTGAISELGAGASVEKAEEFGSEADETQAKSAEAALLGYYEARANGEWSKACSYLAKDLRQAYRRLSKGEGCPAFVEKIAKRSSSKELSEQAELEVESVRVEGDAGYAIYANADGSQQAKPIEEEGGAWKLSSLLVQLMEKARERSQK